MVCSRGESPTLHTGQMKLLNAIATAAVIGASLITASPVEARNGWVYMGEQDGAYNYIKPVGRNGSITSILSKWSDQPRATRVDYNCSTWQKRVGGSGQNWSPIYPGSVAEGNANRFC